MAEASSSMGHGEGQRFNAVPPPPPREKVKKYMSAEEALADKEKKLTPKEVALREFMPVGDRISKEFPLQPPRSEGALQVEKSLERDDFANTQGLDDILGKLQNVAKFAPDFFDQPGSIKDTKYYVDGLQQLMADLNNEDKLSDSAERERLSRIAAEFPSSYNLSSAIDREVRNKLVERQVTTIQDRSTEELPQLPTDDWHNQSTQILQLLQRPSFSDASTQILRRPDIAQEDSGKTQVFNAPPPPPRGFVRRLLDRVGL